MVHNDSFARRVRLRRLRHYHRPHHRGGSGPGAPADGGRGLFVVPLDRTVTAGPIGGERGLDALLGELAGSGVDAVVLHKGVLRHVAPRHFDAMSLIVHMSASTARAPDPGAKCLVAGVEEALRLGADGVSVHVNLGAREEQRQIADLAAVAEACERWSLPLLAMVYPHGASHQHAANQYEPELVAHAATLAADLGADLVKTVFPGSVPALAEVTRGCPIPVLIAGGPVRGGARAGGGVLTLVRDAVAGGAGGVAIGRNVFAAPDPGATARAIADLVHGRPEPAVATRHLRTTPVTTPLGVRA